MTPRAHLQDSYQAFWSTWLETHPEAQKRGVTPARRPNLWLRTSDPDLFVGLFLEKKDCGIYVRGARGADFATVVAKLRPHRSALEAALATPFAPRADHGWVFFAERSLSYDDQDQWPAMIAYLEERSATYVAALADVFGARP